MKGQYKSLIPFYGIYWISSDNNILEVDEHIPMLSMLVQAFSVYSIFLLGIAI